MVGRVTESRWRKERRPRRLPVCRASVVSAVDAVTPAFSFSFPRLYLVPPLFIMNSPQDAWKKLGQQLQRAGGSGGPRMPGKGFFTGTGLLLALVGGGVALNASLFNGTCT